MSEPKNQKTKRLPRAWRRWLTRESTDLRLMRIAFRPRYESTESLRWLRTYAGLAAAAGRAPTRVDFPAVECIDCNGQTRLQCPNFGVGCRAVIP